MNDQAPDDTDPAVHFAETLESAVKGQREITVGAARESWYTGRAVAVDHGVLVLDHRRNGYRLHLRIADIHTVREYLPAGDPA